MGLLKCLLLIFFINFVSFDAKALESSWSFVVISDIHIYPSGRIPEKFTQMVNHIKNLKPDIVFITGDHTNGNRGDSHSEERIQYWYDRLDLALTPLYDSGIMIVPTVGNHDFYELKHQRAYKKWATKTLKKYVGTLKYDTENPLYFKFKYKNQEFFVLKLWTQNIDSRQLEWLKTTSREAPSNNRFAFGHVPIKSVKAPTNKSFYKKMGDVFTEGMFDIYFTGHQHLHWDEFYSFDKGSKDLRQITVGTTSGTYNYPIRRQVRELFCLDNQICESPGALRKFYIEKRNGKEGYQVYRQNFVQVVFDESSYNIYSFGLSENGDLMDFYL